jgi:hypothetical protein
VTFLSGGNSEALNNAPVQTYGQALFGLDVQTKGRFSGFIEGNANFGGGYNGAGGRLGLRIKL